MTAHINNNVKIGNGKANGSKTGNTNNGNSKNGNGKANGSKPESGKPIAGNAAQPKPEENQNKEEKKTTGNTEAELIKMELLEVIDGKTVFSQLGKKVGYEELRIAHLDAGYLSDHYINKRLRKFGWIQKLNSHIGITPKAEDRVLAQWKEKGVNQKAIFNAKHGAPAPEHGDFDPFNLTPKKKKSVKADSKNSGSNDF